MPNPFCRPKRSFSHGFSGSGKQKVRWNTISRFELMRMLQSRWNGSIPLPFCYKPAKTTIKFFALTAVWNLLTIESTMKQHVLLGFRTFLDSDSTYFLATRPKYSSHHTLTVNTDRNGIYTHPGSKALNGFRWSIASKIALVAVHFPRASTSVFFAVHWLHWDASHFMKYKSK